MMIVILGCMVIYFGKKIDWEMVINFEFLFVDVDVLEGMDGKGLNLEVFVQFDENGLYLIVMFGQKIEEVYQVQIVLVNC